MPRANVGDAELEYEVFGPDGGEPLVLIMGIGAQMVMWPEGLIHQLVEQDFQVVRFDNRDVGLSSKLEHLGVPNAGLAFLRALLGLKVTAPYQLSHMAGDVVGLMDHLGWRTAHVAGASMGGMIAQTLGIEHGSRLRSLTSIMSTTGCRAHIGSVKALLALFGPPPTNRDEAKGYVERALAVYGSPGHPRTPEELEDTRERAARAFDRGLSPTGFARQMAAICADGSRRDRLAKVTVPTLVLHGGADPLIPPSAGRATATAIPGAVFELIDGMGHDLPPGAWPLLVESIARHARRALLPRAQHPAAAA